MIPFLIDLAPFILLGLLAIGVLLRLSYRTGYRKAQQEARERTVRHAGELARQTRDSLYYAIETGTPIENQPTYIDPADLANGLLRAKHGEDK